MRKPPFLTFLTLASLCVIGLCLRATAAQPPADKEAARAQAGQAVFNQRCFQCHSVLEGQVRLGPSLYHVMAKPHPRKTPAEVRALLANGKDKMPSFKNILTPEDTDNLLAYLHTL